MSASRPGRGLARLSRRFYGRSSLQAAALLLGPGARASVAAGPRGFEVRLDLGPGERAKAGEFLNEALTHAYRQRVVRFMRDSAAPALAAAARAGLASVPEDPLEMLEPQVAEDRRAEVRALVARAQELERAGGAP